MADESRDVTSFDLSIFSNNEMRGLVLSKSEPLRFLKASENWGCSEWTPEFLACKLGNLQTTFRICARVGSPFYRFDLNKVVTEPDCDYAKASFLNFCAWLKDDLNNSGALAQFPRAHYWCYADYKYMADIFSNFPSLREAPLWGMFGFPEVTGDQSTIWIGSDGSYTPCHLDTYGCNLVAQIYGRKKWILFPPSETDKLAPTRIPYEESSIFSNINIKYPDLNLSPEYSTAIKYEVILEPGDVLLVPKHWWHFVESLEPSISMNTWITLESDHVDRIREAVTRTLVCSMKQCEQEDKARWLNPTETVFQHSENMNHVRRAVRNVLVKQSNDCQNFKVTDSDIIDCITSPGIVNLIANQLIAKAKKSANSTPNEEDDLQLPSQSPSSQNNNTSKEPTQNSCNCVHCEQKSYRPGVRTRNLKRIQQDENKEVCVCCKESPTKRKRKP